MADCFVVFDHLYGKFVNCIIKLLFCMTFFTYCGFPNIFIDVVSSNSWVDSFSVLWCPDDTQALVQTFVSVAKEFQLYGMFRSDNLEKLDQKSILS